jgi:hypothetical protein
MIKTGEENPPVKKKPCQLVMFFTKIEEVADRNTPMLCKLVTLLPCSRLSHALVPHLCSYHSNK